jgi:hypothetical protein
MRLPHHCGAATGEKGNLSLHMRGRTGDRTRSLFRLPEVKHRYHMGEQRSQ